MRYENSNTPSFGGRRILGEVWGGGGPLGFVGLSEVPPLRSAVISALFPSGVRVFPGGVHSVQPWFPPVLRPPFASVAGPVLPVAGGAGSVAATAMQKDAPCQNKLGPKTRGCRQKRFENPRPPFPPKQNKGKGKTPKCFLFLRSGVPFPAWCGSLGLLFPWGDVFPPPCGMVPRCCCESVVVVVLLFCWGGGVPLFFRGLFLPALFGVCSGLPSLEVFFSPGGIGSPPCRVIPRWCFGSVVGCGYPFLPVGIAQLGSLYL